jgi:hypothetical protein
MLGGLVRLILLRVVGARVLLGIAVFEWLRRKLTDRGRTRGARSRERASSSAERSSR